MVVPPIVNEIRSLPAELHPFYMYLREAMGPFAQGPVALIARHDDECVFSADALGLRPLWKLETADDYVFSSEPGVVGVDEHGLGAAAARAGREVHGHDRRAPSARSRLYEHAEMQREVARPLAGAHRRRRRPAPYDRALRDGRAARGYRHPGLHGRRPRRAGQGRRPGPRRLRLAARRRQALPADGVQRRRADRLARLRRAAGGALARAPEPRRLLQGDGRGRHQPGDRPRARDGALLDPRGLRPPAVPARPRDRHPARSRPRSRSSSAATTTWRRSRTRPTARSRASTRPSCSRTCGRSSATAPRRSTSRCSSPRRPRGAIERLKQEAVEGGARRRRAARAHRPHRLRRRAPLSRPAPGDLGGRPGAEAASGSSRARRTCAGAARSCCARRRSATSTTSSSRSGSAPTASTPT